MWRCGVRLSRRQNRGRVVVAVSAVLGLAVVGLVGVPLVVQWSGSHTDAAHRTGVSDGMLDAVVHLRRSDGLFTLPEAVADTTIPTAIHATYLAAQILDQRFPEAANASTKAQLLAFARAASDTPVLQ